MATKTKKQALDFKSLSSTERAVVEALAKGAYTKAGVAELAETTEAKAGATLKSLHKAGWLSTYKSPEWFTVSSHGEEILESLRSGGQAGKPIELGFEDLTRKEQKVVNALAGADSPVLSIAELVAACGWSSLSSQGGELTGKALGNSRVRNQLRRLVRSEWVENAEERGKGTYKLTAAAKRRLANVTKASKPSGAPKRTKKAVKKEAPKAPEAAEAAEF